MKVKEISRFEGAKEAVIEVLKTINDPELPLNIWDLGLIYSIDIRGKNKVKVTMSLTTPSCTMGPSFMNEVKAKIAGIYDEGYRPAFKEVDVELTFEPVWNLNMVSEKGKESLQLNSVFDPFDNVDNRKTDWE
jgi:metal-sulfur cluster biosynthetic enzyme